MSKKTRFPQIRAELRTRQEESRRIGKERQEAKGLERHRLWQEKQLYGERTRHILLAYHFLMGHPYRMAEPKARKDLSPSPHKIEHQIKHFAPDHQATVEQIRDWLRAAPLQTEGQVAA